MNNSIRTAALMLLALAAVFFILTASAAEPINIAVIAPASAIHGRSILQAAEMATDDITAHGGIDRSKIALHKYDDQASATDGVRAFQRAVNQDHAVAVIGNFIS